MTTYNLEEDSNIYFTPKFYDNEFEYRMEHITEEGDRKVIRSIDLRTDKLVIHGTQIQENQFKKLYDSLIIRPKSGIIYVNCDGSCYILISGKIYRPIHNLIFDWSSFGVTIPNSFNDSLKKQIQKTENEITDLKNQISVTESNLKSAIEEVEDLKQQLLVSKKESEDIGEKLKEAFERIALIDFEFELCKIELNSCKKSEEELLDELCSFKEKNHNIELELKKLQCQISAVDCELLTTKIELETSIKSVGELECRISLCDKERREFERELRRVEDEHSLVKVELELIKNEKQCLGLEIEKKFDQVCLINYELMCINQKLDQLLSSKLWSMVYSWYISKSREENGDSSLSFRRCEISSFVIEIT